MNEQAKAFVKAGLNNYAYCASFHVDHPTITPAHIARVFKIAPAASRLRGEARKAPKGQPLTGVYQTNHVRFELSVDGDPQEFIESLLQELSSHESMFREIHATGGHSCLFFGLFADGCCDFEICPSLLESLGALGISLRFDFYGADGGAA